MPRKKIANPAKRVWLVPVRLSVRERMKLGAKLEGLIEAAAIEEAILLWLRAHSKGCLDGTIEDVQKEFKALVAKRRGANRRTAEPGGADFTPLKKDPRVEPKFIDMLGGPRC